MENHFTQLPINITSNGQVSNPKKSLSKLFIFIPVFLILVIGFSAYLIYSRTQTNISKAQNSCPISYEATGRQCPPPVENPACTDYVLVQCTNDSLKCASPNHTFEACGDGCKKINPCMLKCRLSSGIEEFRDICQGPAPTSPPTQPVCTAPNSCMDAQNCDPSSISTSINSPSCPVLGQICCQSKKPVCESPRVCLKSGLSDPNLTCKPGTIDPNTAACSDGGVCCEPNKPTPTVLPTSTPPSPTIPVCIPPKLSVEVVCLTCNQP